MPFTAYAFSKLNFLEDYFWALYVTSPCLLVLWRGGNLLLLLLFLYSSTYLVSNSLQRPIQRWWTSNPPRIWLPPLLLALLMFIGALIPSTSLPSLPSFVVLQSELVDLRVAAELRHPALLVRPKQGEVMLVAQKQFITWSQRLGVYRGDDGEVWHAVILEETIHSDLVLGVQPLPSGNSWRKWKDQSQSPLLAFPVQVWTGLRTPQGMPWKDLCVAEQWFPANRTLLRRRVTGPEAGKLVALHRSPDESDDVVMVFESAPPRGDACPSDEDVPVTQMYLSLDVHVSKPDKHIGANRLDYGFFNAKEKNWIPFIYNGSLHFVYPAVPHVIVSAQEDGRSQRLYSTTYLPLYRLRQKSPHVQIRGSGQAVLIDRPLKLRQKHYLALLHIFDEVSGRYTNYAYRFQSEPPFRILQVSAPLPLTTAGIASGLAVHNDTVLVTYTASEVPEARALVMSLSQLDKFFTCGEP